MGAAIAILGLPLLWLGTAALFRKRWSANRSVLVAQLVWSLGFLAYSIATGELLIGLVVITLLLIAMSSLFAMDRLLAWPRSFITPELQRQVDEAKAADPVSYWRTMVLVCGFYLILGIVVAWIVFTRVL